MLTQATTSPVFMVRGVVLLAALSFCVDACARTVEKETRPRAAPAEASPETQPGADANLSVDAAPARGESGITADSGAVPWRPASEIDGPHEELTLEPGRSIFYAMPAGRHRPHRLVGHIHGMCGAPSYACGKWIGAGTDVGVVVCPTGNARCGDPTIGPPSWEATTWAELVAIMDRDLETAIAKVEKKNPGAVGRTGAVLTGYSRGAYAAPVIARKHPGRWPYLVLIEASVPLGGAALEASGVRAVALVAGEQGSEMAGMRKTLAGLEEAGYPAKLFVMRRTGHLYSDDMENVMHEALAFVTSR